MQSGAESAQTAVVLVIWKKIRSYDGRARLHTGRGTQDLELHGPGLSILSMHTCSSSVTNIQSDPFVLLSSVQL